MESLVGKIILDTRIPEQDVDKFGLKVVRENEKSVWFQDINSDRVYRMNRSLVARQWRVVK